MFSFTENASMVKIEHKGNYGKQIGSYISMENAKGILHNYDFFRTCHEFVYEIDFPDYLPGLKIGTAKNALIHILATWLKRFPKDYWKGLSIQDFKVFFRNYSMREKVKMVAGLIPLLVIRIVKMIFTRVGIERDRLRVRA